ncbi:MAG: 3-keto-5-aminohexanoate cleavage protein [Hyphomicrobiales bacterium]|nr:3-keto-5-aminohexanoate cleavage protein [Hyphomicrobiales bacterium]
MRRRASVRAERAPPSDFPARFALDRARPAAHDGAPNGRGRVNRDVFITCAVTGSGATTSRSDKVPITPAQIADACVEAARAGAAIAHVHVRDPATGAGSRDPALYREVVARVRESGVDVVLNLTAGMGGDMVFGPPERPLPLDPARTDMGGAQARLVHVAELLPEICTLDCGTMNFAESDYVMTNTPGMLRAMAARIKAAGVRPEIEVFDFGHLVLAKELVREGLVEAPVMVQLCMGIPYGAPDDPGTLMALVNAVPAGWTYSAFSIGRMQLPYVAMAALAGGNVRVGLEDNLWLSKGVPATNGALVERAAAILSAMGASVLGPAAVRERLKLARRW